MLHRDFANHRPRFLFLLPLLLWLTASAAFAQSTTFTYQGRLSNDGAPADGQYDFKFTLWDGVTGGMQQPQPSPATVSQDNVLVTSGVFTVALNFGAGAFPGADRFLEISVRPHSTDPNASYTNAHAAPGGDSHALCHSCAHGRHGRHGHERATVGRRGSERVCADY